jgi:hypothetical protein
LALEEGRLNSVKKIELEYQPSKLDICGNVVAYIYRDEDVTKNIFKHFVKAVFLASIKDKKSMS